MEYKTSIWYTAEIYTWWLVFCFALSGALAQFFVTLRYLSLLLLQSDYRPLYWNSYTIGGISRLLALFFGIVWIFFIAFVEYQLRHSSRRKQLRRTGLRYISYALLLLFISWGLLWVV